VYQIHEIPLVLHNQIYIKKEWRPGNFPFAIPSISNRKLLTYILGCIVFIMRYADAHNLAAPRNIGYQVFAAAPS